MFLYLTAIFEHISKSVTNKICKKYLSYEYTKRKKNEKVRPTTN